MNSESVFDPIKPGPDLNVLLKQDWSYPIHSYLGEEAKELLPPNMPAPLGKRFTIVCFVGEEHTGELVTRRSRTGYDVMLNNVPLY